MIKLFEAGVKGLTLFIIAVISICIGLWIHDPNTGKAAFKQTINDIKSIFFR